MKNLGLGLFVVSAVLLIGSLIYQPTVSNGYLGGDTYNLGLLQYQAMFWQLGLALLASGCLLFGIGSLLERLENAGIIKPVEISVQPVGQPVGQSCAWCDQSVLLSEFALQRTLRREIARPIAQYQERNMSNRACCSWD